jgi:hypothetical protein
MHILRTFLVVNLRKPTDIVIDARGTPTLLEKTDNEPDCRLQIKPEYLIQFFVGKLGPIYGIFKDAFFNEARMLKENIRVAIKFAIKFADLLCPVSQFLLTSSGRKVTGAHRGHGPSQERYC